MLKGIKLKRRVQKAGKNYSSFVLYLPKIWCDILRLSKGDELEIEFLPDGALKILPPKNVGEEGPEWAQGKEGA